MDRSHTERAARVASASLQGHPPAVSAVVCETYDLEQVRRAVTTALAPLGGMKRFVRPGMSVLLKPNLVSAAALDRGVTTHPAVVEVVAGLVQEAGGMALVGDSPGGPIADNDRVLSGTGMVDAAERAGAQIVRFEGVAWIRHGGADYFVARPVLDVDLIINLPKLKTHVLTLYTGAIKNLFGVIPGTRKREVHCRAPGVIDFGQALVDVLELVRPGLTIMDGILGQEGNGPGVGGTPHPYGCVVASADPLALDTVVARALGYRTGEVVYLEQASARGLGVSDPRAVQILGDRAALDFGPLDLPKSHWYFRLPGWISKPVHRGATIRPRLSAAACVGCGRCVEVCPGDAIALEKQATIDLSRCIGCLCCAEICPQGAIEPRWSLLARLIGIGP